MAPPRLEIYRLFWWTYALFLLETLVPLETVVVGDWHASFLNGCAGLARSAVRRRLLSQVGPTWRAWLAVERAHAKASGREACAPPPRCAGRINANHPSGTRLTATGRRPPAPGWLAKAKAPRRDAPRRACRAWVSLLGSLS